MKDLKYLVAYALPLVLIVSLNLRGIWSFFTPLFAFVLIPIIEIMLPVDDSNISEKEKKQKSKNIFFDILLYFNIPIIYGIVGWFLWSTTWANYGLYEIIGLTFSVGIVLSSNGINVAHELGHRTTRWERVLSKILLLPAMNLHFYIEHNFGHHLHAATKEDPASAKYNQSVYSFWFTSILGQYRSAWNIQMNLLKKEGRGFLSYKNDMLWYVAAQLVYYGVIYYFFGITALAIAFGFAISALVMLETINYIEHYGLRRLKTASGRYERVKEIHSWNSNHVLGRIMLYELTRHSDHHYRAHKKYQLLEYHEVSPQMPYGYPTSMVISLVPPVWFALMNKRIPEEMKPNH
ncbi:MAG: alkane 1-monooxygenase [Flavobacteriaceae bacterium]|nr:alkane 1-monooxygenase [Flavobacteriaceae bacterium]